MNGSPRIVLEAADVVGESIVYDDRRNALLWVDICGKRIHRLGLEGGRHEIWPTPEFPTSIGLREDGGAIVGLRKRIVLWDYGETFEPFVDIEPEWPANRLNEGCVAPDGSFFVGTMQDNLTDAGEPREMTASTGSLWRVDADRNVTRLTPPEYGIANTLAWTENGHLLTADTLTNTIYQYDFVAQGLSGCRIFASGPDRGLPDGSTLDAEGFLWNCRVGGGSCLARYSPDGSLNRICELPCSWPTSCTFGGRGLATLFVTSARFTMSQDHLAAHPQEGALFAFEPDVTGRPAYRFQNRKSAIEARPSAASRSADASTDRW